MFIDKNLELNKNHETKKNLKKNRTISTVGDYLNLGWNLVTPILLGVFLGISLDKMFRTKPIFILFFIAISVIVSFYNLIQLIKSTSK